MGTIHEGSVQKKNFWHLLLCVHVDVWEWGGGIIVVSKGYHCTGGQDIINIYHTSTNWLRSYCFIWSLLYITSQVMYVVNG